MRIVIDTNVVVSGIFFGGIPGQVIDGWLQGATDLVVTRSILREYALVIARLEDRYPQVRFPGLLNRLAHHGHMVEDIHIDPLVCEDPDDLKFLGAAASGRASCIISGGRHLLVTNGWRGIRICTPAEFLKTFPQCEQSRKKRQ